MTKLQQTLLDACEAGGRRAMRHYAAPAGNQTKVKDPGDMRTVAGLADEESEEAIFETLRERYRCRFLGEESGEVAGDAADGYRFIVDSLDGSINFVRQCFGLFGVSIGAEKGGELTAGAIFLPYFGEMLVAEAGEGAYLGAGGAWRKLEGPERGPEAGLGRARIVIGRGGAEAGVVTKGPLAELIGACAEPLNLGSCSVGLAAVALGRVEGLALPAQRYWDFAGGVRILGELGMPVRLSRPGWREVVPEAALQLATADDVFDVIAAGSVPLFEEMTRILAGN